MGFKKPPANAVKFKKGVSGNPQGARLHNQDLKLIRVMTHDELAKFGSLLINKEIPELREMVEKPEGVSSLISLYSSVIVKAFDNGDMNSLNLLLDRIVGKTKERIDVNVTKFDQMSNDDIIIEIKKKLEQIE